MPDNKEILRMLVWKKKLESAGFKASEPDDPYVDTMRPLPHSPGSCANLVPDKK